ncbi:MAG: hypothetical protein IPN76_34850 [Saprospiraceae bacterium]|nr:hypothetical protein [Saprospiraceae bacterium]
MEVPEKYGLYLNDTRYDVVFELKLFPNSQATDLERQIAFGQLPAPWEFLYDDLNESPEFETDCQPAHN